MFRGFILAAPNQGGNIPRIVEKPLAGGYASGDGALILVDGSGNYAECGTNPALVAAVAISAGGTDTSGFNILGHKEFPPGFMQGIAVEDNTRFLAPFIGSLGTIGLTYGVTKDSDGFWKVDFTKNASNQRVTLLGTQTAAPENQPYVIVSFLAANVQPI